MVHNKTLPRETVIKKPTIYLFILLMLVTLPVFCQSTDYNYLINVDHINKQLSVKICFENAPDYFYTTSSDARKITSQIKWEGSTNNKNLFQSRGYINLPVAEKGCLSYQVNVNLLKDRLNSGEFSLQHPNDFILSISHWLWKPADYKYSTSAHIKFIHDKVMAVSAPWKVLNLTESSSEYLMEYTPDDWQGYVAFGQFEIENIKVNNSHIYLALINGSNKFNKAVTIDWIKQMTKSVESIGGDFPLRQIQVLVIFIKGNNGAVPWGQVNRAGNSGVLFIVNPDSVQKVLLEDWTAAHEFSHLLLPYTPDDRWLSEGFASYFQNISRARTGLISEETAWEKLLAGFARGYKAANIDSAPVLKYANGRSLMQMYWGGAIIALKADAALQQQSAGKYNLSQVMAGLNECCLQTRQSWSAREVFARMDKISATNIFTQLYEQEVLQRQYPHYKSLLNQLGVKENYEGDVMLDNNSAKARIRKEIINGSIVEFIGN